MEDYLVREICKRLQISACCNGNSGYLFNEAINLLGIRAEYQNLYAVSSNIAESLLF